MAISVGHLDDREWPLPPEEVTIHLYEFEELVDEVVVRLIVDFRPEFDKRLSVDVVTKVFGAAGSEMPIEAPQRERTVAEWAGLTIR